MATDPHALLHCCHHLLQHKTTQLHQPWGRHHFLGRKYHSILTEYHSSSNCHVCRYFPKALAWQQVAASSEKLVSFPRSALASTESSLLLQTLLESEAPPLSLSNLSGGFPAGPVIQPSCWCRGHVFNLWSRKIPGAAKPVPHSCWDCAP